MRLLTSSWSTLYRQRDDLDLLGIQPVRISLVYPKFWHAAVLSPSVEELAPRGIFGRVPAGEEYDKAYIDRLDRFGVDVIFERLAEVAATVPGKSLALCCFEPNPANCHRELFRVWWAREVGEIIDEWAAPARAGDQLIMRMEVGA